MQCIRHVRTAVQVYVCMYVYVRSMRPRLRGYCLRRLDVRLGAPFDAPASVCGLRVPTTTFESAHACVWVCMFEDAVCAMRSLSIHVYMLYHVWVCVSYV